MSTENLTDARGFRSPYINRANAALRAQHVIGGDVTAEETAGGTFLWLDGGRHGRRFELFRGHAGRYDVCAVSDGTLYVAAAPAPITPAKYVTRYEVGLDPRGSGWGYAETVPDGEDLTVLLAKAGDTWLLVFRRDSDTLADLMPEDVTDTPEEVCTLGVFRAADRYEGTVGRISQNVTSDLWYGGAGGPAAVLPFTVRVTEDEAKAKQVEVYAPRGEHEVFETDYGLAPRPSTCTAPTGDGWLPLGPLAEDAGVWIVSTADAVPFASYEVRLIPASDPWPKNAARVARVTAGGTVTQSAAGAFSARYIPSQSLVIAVRVQDGSLTEDLSAVQWTRETLAYIATPYGSELIVGDKTVWQRQRTNPKAANTGREVYAGTVQAQTHAADHYEGFVPNASPNP